MRTSNGLALALLLGAVASSAQAAASASACFSRTSLEQRFLLQVNYSEEQDGPQSFTTSRSRIVRFERDGAALLMVDDSAMGAAASAPPLATIPILGERESMLELDVNAGFDRIPVEEDRTGEDYYGRVDRHDEREFRLFDTKAKALACRNASLVFDQEARKDDGTPIEVHYYLSPYRPDPDFRPFEMTSLKHFGFYETYPQQRADKWVLYAMKFGVREPIVFALSATIPERYRDAVRDGVRYWNRALGRPLLNVIDAPADVRAPSPDYNVIEWVTSGEYASTSYIQSDPLTGQILHAHVFVLRETMMDGDLEQQSDHLRYIVAHEIGHALGLRHNFAPRRVTTVMDYFNLTQILKIGRDIRTGTDALPYDREVIRHVYLGEPLDVAALPRFCTDGQRGCMPFPRPPPELLGMKGDSPADD
jgi:Met-zincin